MRRPLSPRAPHRATQSKNKILIKSIECQSTRIPSSTHRQGVLVLFMFTYLDNLGGLKESRGCQGSGEVP